MAKFKIHADTKDAQAKIKDLQKQVRILEREAGKKKRVNMQSGFLSGGIQKVGAASVAMGSFVGGIGANLVSSAFSKLVNVLGAVIPLILKFGFGFKNLVGMANKWTKALEAATNAPEHALAAADRLDALDDERRAHGNKTLGDEYAWDRAFKDVAGDAFKNQLIQRIENLKLTALGGDEESMRILSQLDEMRLENLGPQSNQIAVPTARIGSRLAELSTHELFAEILDIYNKRKASGDYSTADVLEKLIGARGMGVVSKLGDTAALTERMQSYKSEWDKVFSGLTDEMISKMSPAEVQQALKKARELESKMLEQADQSELIRGKGAIHTYLVPDSGLENIKLGAQNQAEADILASKALSNDSSKIIAEAKAELVKDADELARQFKESPFGKFIIDNIYTPTKKFFEDNAKHIQSALSLAEKTVDSMNSLLLTVYNKMFPEVENEPYKDKYPTLLNYGKHQIGRWADFGSSVSNMISNPSFENVGNIFSSMYKGLMYDSAMEMGRVLADKIWGDSQYQKLTDGLYSETPEPSATQRAHFGDNAYKPLGYKNEAEFIEAIKDAHVKDYSERHQVEKENTEAIKKMTEAVQQNTRAQQQPATTSTTSSPATFG